MTSEITTITKGGSLKFKLPKSAQRAWKDAALSVRISSDAIVIQRAQHSTPAFAEMLNEFQKAVKKTKITRKDVGDAIRWARSTKNKER